MSFDFSLTIKGIQEAQNELVKAMARLEAPGPRRQAILYATTQAHRYLTGITHVDTGAYRASQWMKVEGERGELYVNPATVNPRSGLAPAEYSVYEEERGGSHAAYQRTVDEAANILARGMLYGQ